MGRESTQGQGEEPAGVLLSGPERAATVRGRVVTYLALLVVMGVALTGQEAWPLSSFALFSRVRTGESVSVQVVALRRDGREELVDLGRRHSATRGATHLIPHLRAKPRAVQVAEVSSWMQEAGIDPSDVVAARIYRTVREVSRDGTPGKVLRRRMTLQIPIPRS